MERSKRKPGKTERALIHVNVTENKIPIYFPLPPIFKGRFRWLDTCILPNPSSGPFENGPPFDNCPRRMLN